MFLIAHDCGFKEDISLHARRADLHVKCTLKHSRGMYSLTFCPICKSTTINSPSREWLTCWQKAHYNTFQVNGSCVLGMKKQNEC